jgi:hypothetical protein
MKVEGECLGSVVVVVGILIVGYKPQSTNERVRAMEMKKLKRGLGGGTSAR